MLNGMEARNTLNKLEAYFLFQEVCNTAKAVSITLKVPENSGLPENLKPGRVIVLNLEGDNLSKCVTFSKSVMTIKSTMGQENYTVVIGLNNLISFTYKLDNKEVNKIFGNTLGLYLVEGTNEHTQS